MIPKIRVWNAESKMMYEAKSIVYTLKAVLGVNKHALYPEKMMYWDSDDVHVMMSTGVIFSGDEIFEGDIVSDEGSFGLDWWVYGKVVYNSKESEWQVEWMDNETTQLGQGWPVYGNIYENPELLEVSNDK